jgi:hypothetical protein
VACVPAQVSHAGFVVDKVALRQVFSEHFGLPCQFSFYWLLHTHHLSSGAGTIGQLVANVPSGLILTPPQETKMKKLQTTLNHESWRSRGWRLMTRDWGVGDHDGNNNNKWGEMVVRRSRSPARSLPLTDFKVNFRANSHEFYSVFGELVYRWRKTVQIWTSRWGRFVAGRRRAVYRKTQISYIRILSKYTTADRIKPFHFLPFLTNSSV